MELGLGIGGFLLAVVGLLSRYWTTQTAAAQKMLEARVAVLEAMAKQVGDAAGQKDLAFARLEAKIDKLAMTVEHVKETWAKDLSAVAVSIELRLRRELMGQEHE